jgi:hypothetical protein
LIGRLIANIRRQWIGVLALFLVLTGGGAYALSGHNSVHSNDIAPGAVKEADLAGDVKPKAFAFSGPVDADTSDRHVLTNLGGLKLTLGCNVPAGSISLDLYARSSVKGEVRYSFATKRAGGPETDTDTHVGGFDIAPADGEKKIVSQLTAISEGPTSAEGQLVYRGGGRVSTVNFHLQAFHQAHDPACKASGVGLGADL